MTGSDEQLAFGTLVSFAAARAGVTYCRAPVPRQYDHVISGTRGVVLHGWLKWGIDQPWVACLGCAWIKYGLSKRLMRRVNLGYP